MKKDLPDDNAAFASLVLQTARAVLVGPVFGSREIQISAVFVRLAHVYTMPLDVKERLADCHRAGLLQLQADDFKSNAWALSELERSEVAVDGVRYHWLAVPQ